VTAPKFGPHLRKLREKAGFSLRELGQYSDLSASFLSDVELGRRTCSTAALVRIAAAFAKMVTSDSDRDIAPAIARDVQEDLLNLRNEDRIAAIKAELRELRKDKR